MRACVRVLGFIGYDDDCFRRLLLGDMSSYLSMYSNQVANVQLPIESHSHKGVHYAQDIARFCPSVARVIRPNKPTAHRIHVFAHNGRVCLIKKNYLAL